MTLTTEFAIFETSEEFRRDPNIIAPAINKALTFQGVHAPGYAGPQAEGENTGYIALNWDSYEAHQAALEGPSGADTLTLLKPSLGGKTEMYHVQFSGPTLAFEQPVTQVLILSLRAPENRQGVVEILSMISEKNNLMVYGTAREDENKIVTVTGWPTVDAHWDNTKRPIVAATLDKLFSLAAPEHHFHAKMTRFTGS